MNVPLGLTAVLCLALLLTAACADARPTPEPPPAALHAIRIGPAHARVRLARTHAERRHGLMHVTELAADEGMLFVYREANARSIWMKSCRIALDVAFADAAGRVFQITTLQPPTETGGTVQEVRSRAAAPYVLEMPAGFFARHRLGAGAQLQLPAAAERARADP
ncbi:MAG: DUF192 domain-containing protein [Planctomycetota bacterium]|nr:DUF192 domain-containing protein [Planctomycetota bacterium]